MNGVDNLANTGATYISLHVGVGLALMALLMVYTPLAVGVATLLEKILPFSVTRHNAYGYCLATVIGAGGIAFMCVAVPFFRI